MAGLTCQPCAIPQQDLQLNFSGGGSAQRILYYPGTMTFGTVSYSPYWRSNCIDNGTGGYLRRYVGCHPSFGTVLLLRQWTTPEDCEAEILVPTPSQATQFYSTYAPTPNTCSPYLVWISPCVTNSPSCRSTTAPNVYLTVAP